MKGQSGQYESAAKVDRMINQSSLVMYPYMWNNYLFRKDALKRYADIIRKHVAENPESVSSLWDSSSQEVIKLSKDLSLVDMEIDMEIEEDGSHQIKKLQLSDEDFSKIEKLAQSVNNNPIDVDSISNLDVGSIMMDDGEELVFDDIDMATSLEVLENITDNTTQNTVDDVVVETVSDVVDAVELEKVVDNLSEQVVETDELPTGELQSDELPTDTIMMENIVKTTEKKKNSKKDRYFPI